MKSYLKFLSRNKLYTAIEAVGLIVSLAFIVIISCYTWQQFAHRVGFMPSVFLLALVIVGALCSAVVLYHYLKTARMNPAETLKNE
ncbi:MAG: hypothetical protein II383_03150 [Bacteroidales bacterium]|nr:hypothetical protein [Bacteroidales bacterium]